MAKNASLTATKAETARKSAILATTTTTKAAINQPLDLRQLYSCIDTKMVQGKISQTADDGKRI